MVSRRVEGLHTAQSCLATRTSKCIRTLRRCKGNNGVPCQLPAYSCTPTQSSSSTDPTHLVKTTWYSAGSACKCCSTANAACSITASLAAAGLKEGAAVATLDIEAPPAAAAAAAALLGRPVAVAAAAEWGLPYVCVSRSSYTAARREEGYSAAPAPTATWQQVTVQLGSAAH